jgi:membrane-associated phospholipid phosphatase
MGTAGPQEMSSRTGSDIPWFAGRRWAALFVILVLGCTSSAAQTAAPAPPSLGAVFKEVPPDLWHFISWQTGAVLGLGGAAALVGHVWDDDLAGEIETNVTLNNAMAPGHTYGAFSAQALIGVGLYAGGWFARKERLARTGGDIMRAQILSQIYVQAIKFSAQRERPDQSDHYSFPSGHSASAFATAGVLQRHYGWKAGVPAAVVAAYVATARVHDNHHYLSDVIFGAAMGIAAGRTVTLHAGRYGVTLAPDAGAGRAGVVAFVQ